MVATGIYSRTAEINTWAGAKWLEEQEEPLGYI